jgi:carbonic anhydrase
MLPNTLAYYSYMGSVTAPPCTEGVQWIVLRTPVEVSPEQVAAFAKLYPHDVRPTQPLNGRVIQESE